MSLKLGLHDTFLFSPQWLLTSNLEIFNSMHQLYSNIEWIYVNFQIWIPYIVNIWYLLQFNSIFDESINLFFYYYWFISFKLSNFQLFSTFILDIFYKNFNFQFFYSSYWFQLLWFNYYGLSTLFIHPEILWIQINIFNVLYLNLFSEIYNIIFLSSFQETIINTLYCWIFFYLNIFLFCLFLNLYFSFFITITKSQTAWDLDFFFTSISLESEKEISSFDDILLIFIILIYFFGWYFGLNFWYICSILPELIFMFYTLPILYYIIIGIPSFLILDFGIYFLFYLKGIGSSSILIFELIFDYISIIIFYTRILIQGIRLILMLSVYISFQDIILNFSFYKFIFFNFDFPESIENNFYLNFSIFSFFCLFTIPGIIINVLYEILHTYFVVTIQFIAFFAIVFWLFLFLYSFFVLEKQENYFFKKRILKINRYLIKMLKTKIFIIFINNFFQTGWYVDFIVKKNIENFIKYFFIYSGLFFNEKFIIEYLTKIVFIYYISFFQTFIQSLNIPKIYIFLFFLNIILFFNLIFNIIILI